MNDRLKFRIFINGEYFYQDNQYLSSFLRRAYSLFDENATHPAHLDFDIEDKLEQCTGLKDKNGKLIYEGDVLKYSNKDNHHCLFSKHYIVEFGGQDFGSHSYQQTIGWNATPLSEFGKPSMLDTGSLHNGISGLFGCHKVEIIGNIHLDKELLDE